MAPQNFTNCCVSAIERGFDVPKYASLLDNGAPCIGRFLRKRSKHCLAGKIYPTDTRKQPVYHNRDR